MPETTPLIKAALNLRGGAGFDVYQGALLSSDEDACGNGFDGTVLGILIFMSVLLF